VREIKLHFSCFSCGRAEKNQFDVQMHRRTVTVSASGAGNAQKHRSLGNVSDLENHKELHFFVNNIFLLEGSQVLPTCPFEKNTMKVSS